MEYTILSNGVTMPMEGFGVFQVQDPKVCEQAVLDAVSVGYRLIDTAASYGNEEAVGAALKKCGACREDLFITTKLWVSDASYEGAKRAYETSMKKLGLEYLDLYLLHQPMGDYYGAWRALEELYKDGRIRAIGVCNFYPHVLADFCETVEIAPMVNQVELHPFFQQENALKIMRDYEVTPEAWGPFAEGKHSIFSHPVLPKSTHRERMEQNFDVWNFELTDDDMSKIAPLDIGHSEIVDHFDPNFVRALHGRFR